ncbi:beta-ketoacyl synthase N-terminal-like domain-containing protein [Kitasatospora sp. NPDC088351]|uniref:type I polyketide synthase n=1 Tax=Kitasatospora sp. NPDC088351 TaxID=3155180 RepID=UPI0034321816
MTETSAAAEHGPYEGAGVGADDGMDDGTGADIAVVGMAGRFPDAPDLDRFWANLVAGHESIRDVGEAEYLAAGGDPAGLDDPYLVRRASVVDGIELFDAEFFHCRPTEAEVMDPQHRLFLECCYHALEQAGHQPERSDGLTGLYAGASQSKYFLANVQPRLAGRALSLDWFSAGLGNDAGAFATRVAYELNLTGPAVSVQTACSTSLVAVHLACQDLLNHSCDTALAGGASLDPLALRGYRHTPDGPLSPDGRCRAFDAAGAGMSPGNGVGVVVLKRLADALAAGDHIWAVIKGSAINNDGRRKVGFTAPSPQGQAEVILAAQAAAGVDGDSIGYIEAHGTGTALGDPIEVAALTEAFRESTARERYCALGSVKTNLGHLDAAAGIAGLIKTVLALRHRTLPASLHFERPNPAIDFAHGPFYVNTATAPWPAPEHGPRRAAVSSLGIGGTNAHVILEEAPPAADRTTVPPAGDGSVVLPVSARSVVLPVSARTPAALQELSGLLAGHLAAHPGLAPDAVARTLAEGRRDLPYRRAVVARTLGEAAERLARPDPGTDGSGRLRLAYLLPGGGAQHPGMGRGLYTSEPRYRAEIDRAAAVLEPVLGQDLRAVLYEGAEGRGAWSFPALVATEYALARLLIARGARPDALIGHSLGEYTAACLAGVMTLEDALPLVSERERLLGLAGGRTLSVALAEPAVRELLSGPAGAGLGLATVNAPEVCAVSGPADAVERLERHLSGLGVEHRRVPLPTAPHSTLLDPVLDAYAAALRRVELAAPGIPFCAGPTGTWITDEQATSHDYWLRQFRETVRFADGVAVLHAELAAKGRTALVEVGPGRSLSRFARLGLGESVTTVAAMRHAQAELDDRDVLLGALGELWTHGAPIRWTDSTDSTDSTDAAGPLPRKVPLPGYPFQRRRHWIDAPPAAAPAAAGRTVYVLPEGLRDDNYPTTRALAARTRGHLVITGAPVSVSAPAAPAAEPVPAPGQDAAARLAEAEERLRAAAPPAPAGEEERTAGLNRLCTLHTLIHLRRHGLAGGPGETRTRAEVVARLGAVPAYRKLVHALLDGLVADGVADFDPDTDTLRFTEGLVALTGPATAGPGGDDVLAGLVAETERSLTARHPDLAGELELLRDCVAAYDAVLGGTRSGTEVLRPDGSGDRSSSGAERVLAHGDVAVYRELVAEEMARTVREAAGRPLRIVEVGGGQGYLTWPVVEALRGAGPVEYHFTDLGRSFVVAAQKEAADRGLDFLTFGVLDIDKGAAAAELGGFDAVLAFNVLHATPDLRRTVGNLRELLRPGGRAYILEATGTPRAATMTVGLFEGWWYFDDDLREHSPLLPPHRWAGLLSTLGFDPVLALPAPGRATAPDHGLIIGTRPGGAVADGLAAARLAELRALGATVELLADGELPGDQAPGGPAPERTPEEDAPGAAPAAAGGSFNRRPDLATAYVAPVTELEKLVTRHWAAVLGLDEVGVEDNFFDLGGESLLVLQMASRLRDELSVDLAVKKLFEDLTVAAVVREIEALRQSAAPAPERIAPSRRRGGRS